MCRMGSILAAGFGTPAGGIPPLAVVPLPEPAAGGLALLVLVS